MKGSTIASDDREADWRAESDMRALAEAEEIRKDPKRFKAALAKAKEKIAELQGLDAKQK